MSLRLTGGIKHGYFRLFLTCILIVCLANLQAQSYSSVHYDTKDGLPSATVYDISQDKDGVIWFATENGLSRFDGKNFKTFTTRDGLPDNSVLQVHADNLGRVYFTPFTHDLHYYRNDSFFRVLVPEQYRVDMSNAAGFINKKDKIIIGVTGNCYVLENNKLIPFVDMYKQDPDTAYVIRVYDSLIITQSENRYYYINESGTIRSYPRAEKNEVGIVFDENVVRRQLKITRPFEEVHTIYMPGNRVLKYANNIAHIFDMGSGDLLYRIRMEKYSSAFIDNENSLWFSTIGNGVYRFPSFAFRNMSFDGRSEVFSFVRIGNQIIAGSDHSRMYYLPQRSADTSFSTVDLSAYSRNSENPIARIAKRNRVYVMRSSGDNLYIGTDGFLLKKKGRNAPVFSIAFPVKDIDVLNKELLVCTGNHLLLLNEDDLSTKDTLLFQRATCGQAYKGHYYVGTLGGLIRIDPASKKVTELRTSFPAFGGRITAIQKGLNDDLWIATSGAGLVRYKNGKIVQAVTEENGLTSNICTSLFIDSFCIWLGTDKGLNRIEFRGNDISVMRLTSANGLGADFINAIIATDSNVYVGTTAGVTLFTKNIQAEHSVCMLHILGVTANNKPLDKDSSYSFPYNTLNIRVDFTAISFKSAGDITYYYQLKGLDEEWQTTNANFINFSTLQPGGYTLILKAVNKFGVESAVQTIYIAIDPPWWQTWFFRITALAALALLILGIYWYNVRDIRRKEEMKREFEARFASLEQMALQAQMNPHFIFNALNSIQTFILNLDVEGANTYLANFASLIKQTLDNSMNPLISIASEITYIETYLSLEKLRFRDKFSYEIHIDETIDQKNTMLPGMLLQPYIENSLRHGIQHRKDSNGLIALSITNMANNAVVYKISDNGVGRKRAGELKSSRHIEYQSRGTSINEKRIAAINSQFKTNMAVRVEDIIDENGMVAGTEVTLLIPSFAGKL